MSRIFRNVVSQSVTEMVFRICTISLLPAIIAGSNTSCMKASRFSMPSLLFDEGKSLAKSSRSASIARKSGID
jgi:hypothetical protein